MYNEQMQNLHANFQQQQAQYEEHFKGLKTQAGENETELEWVLKTFIFKKFFQLKILFLNIF